MVILETKIKQVNSSKKSSKIPDTPLKQCKHYKANEPITCEM